MDAETRTEEEVHDGVDRLVAEIDRAVGLIESLRRENAGLKTRCEELSQRVQQQESALGEARGDRDRLQQIYEDNAALIEKKGDIKTKIDTMLSRLDSLAVD